jgi:hypothetical protein
MKKFSNLGTILSRTQVKQIVGGAESVEDFASCTFTCHCSDRTLRLHCNTGSCSGTDDVGGTCNGSSYTCSWLCSNV